MILDTYRPVDATLTAAIHNALAPYREVLGIQAVRIMPDEDYDGDAVIRVSLEHQLVDPQTAFATIHEADRKLRQTAWESGERRFVHVRHLFADQTSADTSQ